MKARVHVFLKSGVLDPQGEAILKALGRLGYPEVREVRQGKFFELDLQTSNREQAVQKVGQMADKLLANTVVEDFRVELL